MIMILCICVACVCVAFFSILVNAIGSSALTVLSQKTHEC